MLTQPDKAIDIVRNVIGLTPRIVNQRWCLIRDVREESNPPLWFGFTVLGRKPLAFTLYSTAQVNNKDQVYGLWLLNNLTDEESRKIVRDCLEQKTPNKHSEGVIYKKEFSQIDWENDAAPCWSEVKNWYEMFHRQLSGLSGSPAEFNNSPDNKEKVKAYINRISNDLKEESEHLEPKTDSAEIQMEDIPDVVYSPDVIGSVDIKSPVLSWVTTVGDLFNRQPIKLQDGRKMRPGKFVIPNYQRKYAWEARQIGQLCRDLLHSVNDRPNESYHLGTLIFHRDTERDFFYVVDGQQRLTTISRLLGRKIFHAPSDPRSEKVCEQQFTEKDARLIFEEFYKYSETERETIRAALRNCTLVCIAVTDITESFQLFSTQNGRGRPLTPVNLLKAFHLHEIARLRETSLQISDDECRKIDEMWEALSSTKTPRDGRLLSQVIGEHLYRLRNWCTGAFPEEAFSNTTIDEFKGLTIGLVPEETIPLQNLAVLRHRFASGTMSVDEQFLARRIKTDGMNLFVSVEQPIINGKDFFEYVVSYAKAYKLLFCNGDGMEKFSDFHKKNCYYAGSGRQGDTYARHIFESLALFCFDRFGKTGLINCMRELFCCAYYERLVKLRCYYATCGSEFAIKAVRCMLRSMTLVDLMDRLQDLSIEVREKVREQFKNKKGEKLPAGLETVKSVFEGKGK